MPKTAKTKIVLRFANYIFIGVFTDSVKMRVNMKQAISPDLFQSFAAGLPIVRECKLDSDKVATLKLQNDDEKVMLIV